MKRRTLKGHSLLELMVVIAIIFVLLAMSMPTYVRAIRMAREVTSDTR